MYILLVTEANKSLLTDIILNIEGVNSDKRLVAELLQYKRQRKI